MIVIPALNPDKKLIQLLQGIRQEFNSIYVMIINDGSGQQYDDVFDEAKDYVDRILHHERNFGKGVALKTAIHNILADYPDVQFMTTVDADGQHQVSDIRACIDAAYTTPNALVLGTRTFEQDIPLRSKFGNILTRNVLKLMTGIDIEDTQTGLRVVPRNFMPLLLDVEGERYEFETNMLVATKTFDIPIVMQSIHTIYIDDNLSSHFRVVSDSLKIYSVFIKYIFISILSFLIDIIAYALIIRLTTGVNLGSVSVASLLARSTSSIFNYLMNRNHVFQSQAPNSMIKYFILAFFQISMSSLLVYIIALLFNSEGTVIIKGVVDSLLFLISYLVQKYFIFKE